MTLFPAALILVSSNLAAPPHVSFGGVDALPQSRHGKCRGAGANRLP